jgi:6-phosphogluconolactonase
VRSGGAAFLRGFMAMAFALMGTAASGTAASAATYVYVGNAGNSEITVLSLDPKTGDLTEVEKVAIPGITKPGGSTPIAISPNKKFLYVGLRGEPQVAAAFAIDGKSGKLKHIGNGPLADSMAYIATDRSGKYLLSASYPGHKVTVNPIAENGTVLAAKQTIPNLPNSHAILADKSNRHVLSPSLGADAVNQFTFDAKTGTLTPNATPNIKTTAKSGPRHLRFSNNEKFVYLLNELDATIYVLLYDAKSGTLKSPAQTVNIMPPGSQVKAWAADLHLTPDGKYLYASERTTSMLAAFKIDPKTGKLTAVESYLTEQQPRGFAIAPSGRYLYAVGEKSDSMTSYAIDPKTGKLAKLKQYKTGKSPNWVEIVNLP